MTRVLALADQSKIGCIPQRRFAKVGTKPHPQRGADLGRNGLSVSTETACRFEPKSPVGNSEICSPHPGRCGVSPFSEPRLLDLAPFIARPAADQNPPRGLRRPPDQRRPDYRIPLSDSLHGIKMARF